MEDFINTKNNVIGIENNTITQDPRMDEICIYLTIFILLLS